MTSQIGRSSESPAVAGALRWLLGTLMPWWRERIVDPRGGYFEGLDASGGVDGRPRRTTLTQARLVYVKPPPAWRRQNPHMHLFEAYLAWHAVDPGGPWLACCRSIVALLQQHFLDATNGTLIEYFHADWRPADGAAGRWREPGHHLEWTWLLHQYHRQAPAPALLQRADALWRFATAFGLDPDGPASGLAFDGVDSAGLVLADTKLLWPQTELTKACAARVEAYADPDARALGEAAWRHIRGLYFDAAGTRFVNQLSRDGSTRQGDAPARILYHVFLAVAELDRVMAVAFKP